MASACSRSGIWLKEKEEEAIEMALLRLRGKVDTGRYHSAGEEIKESN